MKKFMFILFLMVLSCSSSEETNSSIYRPDIDGILYVSKDKKYVLDDFVSTVKEVRQPCRKFVINLNFIVFEKDHDFTHGGSPYRLSFLIPAQTLDIQQNYPIVLGPLEDCIQNPMSNQAWVEKIGPDQENFFYDEEPYGWILKNPEGTILFKTNDIESTDVESWVNYEVEFELMFVTPQGQELLITGNSQGKLFYRYAGSIDNIFQD